MQEPFCYDIAEAKECLLPAANQFACTIYMVYFYLSNLSVHVDCSSTDTLRDFFVLPDYRD